MNSQNHHQPQQCRHHILRHPLQTTLQVEAENGKPNKKEYRKYKIKTVEGPDDYASMREVIRRRYSRVKRDGLTPPDLIIMDGGQGQVNVAKDVLRNELNLSIPVAGLQKNDKHQTNELLFGDPLQVIELPRQSEEFFLLHRIQV